LPSRVARFQGIITLQAALFTSSREQLIKALIAQAARLRAMMEKHYHGKIDWHTDLVYSNGILRESRTIDAKGIQHQTYFNGKGSVLLTGCIKTVSRQELNTAIHSHDHETVSWVNYVGSHEGFHYIRHGHAIGVDTYRIAESDFKIDDPFPLTKNERKWRTLKKSWDLWGCTELRTNSQQNAASLPCATQTGHSEKDH
jgi:hypothetical protein